ncbi:MAG: hypothetical protein LC793_03980 [Thermomicrobia bacterium]|nr:hypothetical protein [Thermomicrobia bacterium]
MERREEPIEGAHDSQATPPTRTGDDVPTSTIVPTEAKTMGLAPFIYGGIGLVIAVIVMIIFILIR